MIHTIRSTKCEEVCISQKPINMFSTAAPVLAAGVLAIRNFIF